MTTQFKNRAEAGHALATKLTRFANRSDVLVLALPRGGVPVAAEVAKSLNAPLDVFVVRKLGLPYHPELAMGAIASGGVRVINRDVVEGLRISQLVIDTVAAQEQEELARRQRAYRDDLPSPQVKGKTIILVDDGIATGSTMIAAVLALRQLGAARIVAAAPVIPRSTFDQMHHAADEVATVIAPEEFHGVGQWYENFSQTTDDEVRSLLAQTNHHAPAAAA
ncbi:MAG TPA: phosphoribosyltransferase [Chthoniobacterales bacterium]|nr:phosphoribosyltransferase [Chthoniobacterales bacterium]